VRGLKIGVLREGFEHPGASEKVVDDAVREAASAFAKLGATVREVSIPMHLDSTHIYNPIFTEGVANHIGRELGIGTGWKGYYNTSLLDAYGRARQAFASNLSDTIKSVIFAGHYTMTRYYGHYYAKAMNLSRLLTDSYNQALKEVDLLVMPTTPRRANAHIFKSTRAELAASGWWWHFNTCAFDITGHPAMNVPCGKADGLPIGMELVGRHFEDSVLLRAAHAFESLGIYKGLERENGHRNGQRPASSRSTRSRSTSRAKKSAPARRR
jgi:amidase